MQGQVVSKRTQVSTRIDRFATFAFEIEKLTNLYSTYKHVD
jgi:hypothetical protein